MKHTAKLALIINIGAAALFAQSSPVNTSLSGSSVPSTVNLQPGTPASEYDLAGNGTLGPITVRVISASAPADQPPGCSGANYIYGTVVGGAGVFRVQNGDLLIGSVTGGSDCIDLLAGHAQCIRLLKIISGTGRFKGASGNVKLTMTVTPVFDALHNPVLFSITADTTGSVTPPAGQHEDREAQPAASR